MRGTVSTEPQFFLQYRNKCDRVPRTFKKQIRCYMTPNETIYNTSISDGMPPALATLITAQANHETNGFTSNVFKTCNNAFGYKYVGQSLATGACVNAPEGDQFAKYLSLENSTHEITAWIKRRQQEGVFPADLNTITTPDQYAALLKDAGYYGDTEANYTNGLIYWLQQIGNVITRPTGAAILLVIIAIGLIYFRTRKK